MNFLRRAWDFVDGFKTYAIALAGIVWGLSQGSTEVVLAALGLAGLRHGVSK